MLKESGFFSTDPIDLGGAKVKPLDFTSRIIFEEWKLGETEEEITVIRVTVRGEKGVFPPELVGSTKFASTISWLMHCFLMVLDS